MALRAAAKVWIPHSASLIIDASAPRLEASLHSLAQTIMCLIRLFALIAGVLLYTGVVADESAPDPIPVRVAILSELTVYPEQRTSANVLSLNHADISAETSGRIVEIKVRVGDQLAEGDVLILFDCSDADLALASASASLSLANSEWQRLRTLKKGQNVSEQLYKQSRSSYDLARIGVKQAELQVSRCQLRAPFAGVVTERYAQLGTMANPGMPMVKLLDTVALEGAAALTSSQIESIRNASDRVFIADGVSYPIQVRVVQPFRDQASGQQMVRFEFVDNAPIAGSSGELVWRDANPHLPTDYVVMREQSLGYFIVADQTARFVVLPKAVLGHPTPIQSDDAALAAEQVITDGRYRVADGDTVSILQP